MEQKGQLSIASVAIAALMFVIVLGIYSAIYGSQNYNMFGVGVGQLIALLPLVLVGGTIIAVVVAPVRVISPVPACNVRAATPV